MDVLFHAELAERDFGNYLLSVAKLTAWAQQKDLELMTLPPLAGFRFVQAEALLCAIERGASTMTPEQAAMLVHADPVLSKHEVVARSDGNPDPTFCRWLLGADAHRSWRRLLENAIEKQELTLLNFNSKLPVQQADSKPQAVQTLPVHTVPAPAAQAPVIASPMTNWRHAVQAEAWEHWLRLRASGCSVTVYSICDDMARWCLKHNIKGDKGQDPKSGTIRNTVLGGGHWVPPHHSVAEAKKHIAQIAQTAQTNFAQTAQ